MLSLRSRTPSKPFQPGHPKLGGRKPGAVNKFTRLVKEAVLAGAEQVGSDGKGRDGLIGYMRRVALRHPDLFVPLLAKIMPLQLNVATPTQPSAPLTLEEVKARLEREGLPFQFQQPMTPGEHRYPEHRADASTLAQMSSAPNERSIN